MRFTPLLLTVISSSLLLLAGCLGTHRGPGAAPTGFDRRNRYDRHDRPQGRWRTFYDDERQQPYTSGRYRHGRPVGTFRYYTPTGQLDKTERYGREGFGDVTYWYPSGKPARRGRAQWLTGKQGARFYWFGPWTSFSEQGDTTALETYVDGQQATRILYENGRRAALETYDARGRVQSTQRLN